jgi:hypothetical protein
MGYSIWLLKFILDLSIAQPFVHRSSLIFDYSQDVDADKSPISVDGALAASSLFKIIVDSHLKGTVISYILVFYTFGLEECCI